jgi:alpha-L-fucosidase
MRKLLMLLLLAGVNLFGQTSPNYLQESEQARDQRMAWWREARLGLFIHWGLYAVPAGSWNGKTDYGEWIRHNAEIPLHVYDQFLQRFNPVQFNADQWVTMAKEAGMKYIVITSKHHDGFCLFDSKYTDFDVMSTPFQRDILKELAEACRRQGMKMCWYHSIMDWHHPDYLPRREWEKDRSAANADFDRYVQHMKKQLQELVGQYGDIGVLWFDGEWESTWNSKRGDDLYQYVRSLQPSIIINNRVGASRSGMEGMNKDGQPSGDFGTPEQQIPATGLPGVDWETCMTMNDHWGFNQKDQNWKSSSQLIRMLTDIASKGGNYLLNVGPTAEGLFPAASVERLQAIGKWMKVNGESIYGTQASPFMKLKWGRCTRKEIGAHDRLYLHVFEWPQDGRLVVPGLFNSVDKAYLLADPRRAALPTEREEDAVVVRVPVLAPDSINSVLVLELNGTADVSIPPEIQAVNDVFIDQLAVQLRSNRENVVIRYTIDTSVPTTESFRYTTPLQITKTTTITARCFRANKPVSAASSRTFTLVKPQAALPVQDPEPGLRYRYYEGDWDQLPDFAKLTAIKSGEIAGFDFSPGTEKEHFGFVYQGLIKIPTAGVYTLFIGSDDGSRLYLDEQLLVDNDGLHGLQEKSGVKALLPGFHRIRVEFFDKTGGEELHVYWQGPGVKKQAFEGAALFHE